MTIVLTGGGSSAGHITPSLAVAHELKRLNPAIQVVYIGHRGDQLGMIAQEHASIDKIYTVRAGKLRRYHGASWRQLLDLRTMAKNIRDIWWVVVGVAQSFWLLLWLRPDAIFIKGSYVGMVVGLAAAALRIPFITHDSDAMAGLGNRVVARWAKTHAVAVAGDNYPYERSKIVTVGVPVRPEFVPVTPELETASKAELKLAGDDRVLLVTGGGQGARRLNEAVIKISAQLIEKYPNIIITHMAGQSNEVAVKEEYDELLNSAQRSRVIVKGFVSDLYRYSAAAEVVVTRAGATNIAEFALQGKACIMVPNPYLAGGHQIKNAELLARDGASEIVTETELKDHGKLLNIISELFDSKSKRRELGERLHKFAQPESARDIAKLLINIKARH